MHLFPVGGVREVNGDVGVSSMLTEDLAKWEYVDVNEERGNVLDLCVLS